MTVSLSDVETVKTDSPLELRISEEMAVTADVGGIVEPSTTQSAGAAVISALGASNLLDQGPTAPVPPSNPVAALIWGFFRRIQTTWFNSSPTASSWQDPGQSALGVVTGDVGEADPDGDPLTVALKTVPAKGSAIVNADGTYTYTPSEALAASGGTDTFTVTISETNAADHIHGLSGLISRLLGVNDGSSITKDVTVTIAPVTPSDNHAPVAGEPAYSIVLTDQSTGEVSGSLNVTDPDNDRLTYTLTDVLPLGDGRVTVDPETGNWTYAPSTSVLVDVWDRNLPKEVRFSITVADGEKSLVVPVLATASPSLNAVINSVEYMGSQASGVAVGPDGRIYVTNSGANTLTVVDPTSGALSTTKVGRNPTAVAIDEQGRVWVANTEDGSVTVLNADGAVVRTVSVGTAPTSLVVKDGFAYLTNYGDDSVSVIAANDDFMVHTISNVGSGPIDLAINPIDGFLYVTNFDGGTITVVNAIDRQVLNQIDSGGEHPHGIAIAVDGTIYVAHPLEGVVTILTRNVVDAPAAGRSSLAASASVGTHSYRTVTVLGSPTKVTSTPTGVYISNSAGKTITVLDPLTLAATTVTTGNSPNNVFADSAGNVYVTNGGSNTVSIIDAQTRKVRTMNVGVKTGTVTVNAAGELTLVRSYDGQVMEISASRTGASDSQLNIITTHGGYSNVVQSYDGSVLYGIRTTATLVDEWQSRYTYEYDLVSIDPSTGAVLDSLRWPMFEYDTWAGIITPSQDGTRLFIAHSYFNDINENWGFFPKFSVIDTSGSTLGPISTTVDLTQAGELGFVTDVVMNSSGSKAYVLGNKVSNVTSSYYDGTIWEVDLSAEGTPMVTEIGFPEPEPEYRVKGLAISSNGDRVFFGLEPPAGGNTPPVEGAGDNFLAMLDTDTHIVSVISLGEAADGFADLTAAADGSRVYISSGQVVSVSDGVMALDASRQLDLNSGDYVNGPTRIELNYTENHLIVVSANGAIEIYDLSSGLRIGDPQTISGPVSQIYRGVTGTKVYVSYRQYQGSISVPTSVADLWGNVRNLPHDGNGGVFVQTVRDNDEVRLIVYLGGTNPAHWLWGNQAVGENVSTELGILKDDQKEAIVRALDQCRSSVNCGSVEEVMIVGYSQGGIDAQNFAEQWDSLDYGVELSAILTFGSPIIRNSNVPTLHLQDIEDEVINLELLARTIGDLYFTPVPDWLMADFTAGRQTALRRGEVYQGNATTTFNLLDPFYVHGNIKTYAELSADFDLLPAGGFAAQAHITKFLRGDVIVPIGSSRQPDVNRM